MNSTIGSDVLDILNAYPALLAVAIFLARIMDVSLGTLRTIVVFRGYRVLAAILGFFEVMIWLLAAGQVFQNLKAWHLAVAYAGGFAAGNIVGSWLEAKLAIGSELLRVISENRQVNLAERLRDRGYDVTELAGLGDRSIPVEILLVIEKRRRMPRLLRLIHDIDPDALCTTSDIKRPATAIIPQRRATLPLTPDWLKIIKKK
jgi:uncharacterized protein YebE (UPF0316 family)